MMKDPYLGWIDPVGKLVAFRVVIKHLVRRTDNFRVQMDKATYPLVVMQPDEFPERIRNISRKVLAVRSAVAKSYVTDTLFHFERLTPKQRKAFISDIVSLYEALLIDLGRMGDDYDFIYPKDIEPPA
jgi:hypothetical protein